MMERSKGETSFSTNNVNKCLALKIRSWEFAHFSHHAMKGIERSDKLFWINLDTLELLLRPFRKGRAELDNYCLLSFSPLTTPTIVINININFMLFNVNNKWTAERPEEHAAIQPITTDIFHAKHGLGSRWNPMHEFYIISKSREQRVSDRGKEEKCRFF